MPDEFSTWGIPGFENWVEVGQGASGVVYRARQVGLGWEIAVKILTQTTTHPAAVNRFHWELERMATLAGHPQIVTTYDWGMTASDHLYVVMEYMAAGSLADRIRRDGPLKWQEAAAVGVKLAGALEDAHRLGVLHLGVRPENVLMSEGGEPKLSEFGTGWLPGLTLSVTRTLASFVYSAPELLERQPPTAACDVYSLAATVYMLMAGHPPFSCDADELSPPVVLRVNDELQPDLRLRGVPDAVFEVLERGMAMNPADRLSTATAFGHALKSA
jgi:serine/threonine protein kinase